MLPHAFAARRILDAAPDGVQAVMEAFLRECIALLRLSVRGVRAAEVEPTVLVERVNLPDVAGQVNYFGEDRFRNGTAFDFVCQGVIPCVFGTSDQREAVAEGAFAVKDRDSNEYILGAASQRLPGGMFIDGLLLPTPLCFFPGEGHIIRPGGGLLGEVEALSADQDATVVEVAVPGYWVRRW